MNGVEMAVSEAMNGVEMSEAETAMEAAATLERLLVHQIGVVE
jgi:hypothetical protein